MLKEIGIEDTSISSLRYETKINSIKIKNAAGATHINFDYRGENYFYKYNNEIIPYNELVAEELAKDYGIFCPLYDLAILNGMRGVISKNYKKENATYIDGNKLLQDMLGEEKCLNIDEYNNLSDIWSAIDYRYKNRKDSKEITFNLMRQVVDKYLFDIITCQCDGGVQNWEIEEEGNSIKLCPYDNERILIYKGSDAFVSLSIDCVEDEDLWKSLEKFQQISGDEFTNIVASKIWIISPENLESVFERIDKNTGYLMPDSYKEYYLNGYRNHKERLEKIIFKDKTPSYTSLYRGK